jgi:transcription initiation factor TFIIIB Brf1 subunit/transcription initiation factor TFIIB
MGGYYTAGETFCQECGLVLRHGEKVVMVQPAEYDEHEESLESEPHTEELYHEPYYHLKQIDSLRRV